MSLVNDMLRDLDQRRRDSESATAAVKLMPASDSVKKKSKGLLLLLCMIAVVAASLGYIWLQMENSDATQNLNIRPSVVTTNQPVESVTLTSSAARTEEQLSSEATNAGTDNAEPLVTENNGTALTGMASAPSLSAFDSQLAQQAAISPAVEQSNSQQSGQEVPVAEANQTLADLSATARAPESATVASNTRNGADVTTGPTLSSGETPEIPESEPMPRVDLQNPDSQESVRSAAEMTPEVRDTMAVKKALELIANNQVTDAYAHLESHIVDNRYAHQSRETFAKLLLNDGQLLAAYNLVESGLGLAPNHAGFKKVKARILISDGQVEDAVDLLSRRAPSVQEDVEYHEILATAQLANRDFEGALISYTGLVRQDQNQGRWWYGFAASQDSLGNASAARQGYTQALQKTNLSPNLRRRSQERLSALAE